MKSFKQINFLLLLGVLLGRNIAVDLENNGCSKNSIKCHPEATCVSGVGENDFTCICKDGFDGDGLGATGCGPKKCESKKDCHFEADCTEEHLCACKTGFTGTPSINCTDIDECKEAPGMCGEHAICINTYGSYECKCDTVNNYYRNGDVCELRCNIDEDCKATGTRCALERRVAICVCKEGYKDVNEQCENINECQESTHECDKNAICTDFDGGYNCTCKNGFSGDGFTCKKLKKNCQALFEADSKLKSGDYEIDPDETGPLGTMKVYCEMRKGENIGITIMKLTQNTLYFEPTRENEINISYINTPEEMKAVIDEAKHCTQSASFKCVRGAELMNGDHYWVDGTHTKQYNWGGANNMCLCGSFGVCQNADSNCNCDGKSTKSKYDNRDITDRGVMPVTALKLTPTRGKGVLTLGDVKCAPQSFDIPRDCYEERFTNKNKKNGVRQIDVDGKGPIPPFYVHCNMTEYKHVGVTEVMHNWETGLTPGEPGSFKLMYKATDEQLRGLVNISNFCSQEVEYECKNSQILRRNGEMKAHVSALDGTVDESWPGANGVAGKCGCGLFEKCENPSDGCNCDIMDGKTRKDSGKQTDKRWLPIGSVTLNDIDGAQKTGTITVSKLSCSQRVFNIDKSCHDHVVKGAIESATILIDPDGPARLDSNGEQKTDNDDPYPAYCSVEERPSYGVTQAYHEYSWSQLDIEGTVSFEYMFATSEQLLALTTRSTSCTQTVKFTCRNWPVHDEGKALLEWVSVNGKTIPNLHGYNTKISACSCGLDDPNTCVSSDKKCNCDVADDVERTDTWVFSNKEFLPVGKLISQELNSSSIGKIDLGPLQCTELLDNCADITWHKSKHRKDDEDWFKGGYQVINPQAKLGVPPFTVLCTKTKTEITATITEEPIEGSPDEDIDKCFSVKYTSKDGEVTKEQVQALVITSKFCGQKIDRESVNAPITNMSWFSTCNDIQQTGWAGGVDKCPCGETATCLPGPDFYCNSDKEDGNTYTDGGWIVEPSRLGVCKVCVKLSSTSSLTTPIKARSAKLFVSDLYCDKNPIGSGKNCEDRRVQGEQMPSNQIVRINGKGRNVYCNISTFPPFAFTEIKPKTPEIVVTYTVTTTVEYFFYFPYLIELIEQSSYCLQHIFLQCGTSSVNMTGYGWFDKTSGMQMDWTVNEAGTSGCGGEETCSCNLGQNPQDSSIIFGTKQFPIRDVSLDLAEETGTISPSTIKCFDIRRTCHDILLNKENTDPNENGKYPIDPDQAAGVDPFFVDCDFKIKKNKGITRVKVIKDNDRSVTNATWPGLTVDFEYEHASFEQIHALSVESEFCLQGIDYLCKNSIIYGEGGLAITSYETYGERVSPSWGSAQFADVEGCACAHTKSCVKGNLCNCDATGKMQIDKGYETQNVPIIQARFSGQTSMSSARYDITDVVCGPVASGLPKHCDEAFVRGDKRTTTHLIQPKDSVPPFLVQCDMANLTKGGVTIVKSTVESRTNVTYGESVSVGYYAATIEQLLALIEVSEYCYQPIKIQCKNTKLIAGQEFWWTGHGNTYRRRFVGGGNPDAQECNCGRDSKCGGSELRPELLKLNRGCNCDANDDEWRADAGVIPEKEYLPVEKLMFEKQNSATNNPEAAVVIGPLVCGQEKFDINECRPGFHDCHKNAECKNVAGTYTCKCNPGYEGKGRLDVLVNGRNCYDDDECAIGKCPRHADCINTDGSYECSCHTGFKPHGNAKRKCVDINECEEGIDGCDPNADCFNRPGDRVCRCKRNYLGNGTSCKPFGLCEVYGDPHVRTYDGNVLSYQGACSYVLSRDICDDLDAIPTFQVTAHFYQKYRSARVATWIEGLTLNIRGHIVELQQAPLIARLNGLRVDGSLTAEKFEFWAIGSRVVVEDKVTQLKLDWDHDSNIAKVHVPGDFATKTCGLCGDYNGDPMDDFIIGPACDDTGKLTANTDLFGESWLTPGPKVCTADCSITTTDPCTPEEKVRAQLECDRLYDKHSLFKACLNKMENVTTGDDRSMKDALYATCVTDVCRVNGDIQDAICPHAKMLHQTCSSEFNIEIGIYRTDVFCSENCGETKDYHHCRSSPEETCSDNLLDTIPVFDEGQCYEGCFCKEGFVLEDTQCVLPEECGCIKDNTYYKKGENATDNDCGQKQVCLGNNTFSDPNTIKCDPNAKCTIKNGVQSCHCNDGYYGDGESCIVDPCDPSPCGVKETCIHNLKTEKNYECECGEGMYGDCGACEDLNECETELRFTCPSMSKCINEIGSFRCECHDGYKLSGGKCLDDDECKLAKINNETICGENSICLNKIGHYDCRCCYGYEEKDGVCIESSSATALSGEKCCICNKPRCNEDLNKKVCGTDGETYDNYKELMIEKCERDDDRLELDYYGKCKGSCDGRCPEYQTCAFDKRLNMERCMCDTCTPEEVTTSGKVCTKKYEIYANMCEFIKMQCRKDVVVKTEIFEDFQQCEHRKGAMPIGDWSEWSPCSKTCGKGTTTRTRDVDAVIDDLKQYYPESQNADCYKDPCPGPCEGNLTCKARSAECVVNELGEAECECPTCINIEKSKVCGYIVSPQEVEVVFKTWNSACELQREACKKKRKHNVYTYGSCDVDPLECNRRPLLKTFEDDNGYKSKVKVDVAECRGVCDETTSYCCEPIATEPKTVTMVKEGAQSYRTNVTTVTGCFCKLLP